MFGNKRKMKDENDINNEIVIQSDKTENKTTDKEELIEVQMYCATNNFNAYSNVYRSLNDALKQYEIGYNLYCVKCSVKQVFTNLQNFRICEAKNVNVLNLFYPRYEDLSEENKILTSCVIGYTSKLCFTEEMYNELINKYEDNIENYIKDTYQLKFKELEFSDTFITVLIDNYNYQQIMCMYDFAKALCDEKVSKDIMIYLLLTKFK